MRTIEFKPDSLRKIADAKEAFDKREPFQYYDPTGIWYRVDAATFSGFQDGVLYRPAPVPAPSYWSEPAHIPGPVCWIRPTYNRESDTMILATDCRGAYGVRQAYGGALDTTCVALIPWMDFQKAEYSTDRKEWKACLVQP